MFRLYTRQGLKYSWQFLYNCCCYSQSFGRSSNFQSWPMEMHREDMWHWLFDCLADAILQEHLHSLQFKNVAQLCSTDFLLGLFTPQPHALSNAQCSGGLPTLWPSVQSLTTFPQDRRLHLPQTWNVMLCSGKFSSSLLLHKITETTYEYKSHQAYYKMRCIYECTVLQYLM